MECRSGHIWTERCGFRVIEKDNSFHTHLRGEVRDIKTQGKSVNMRSCVLCLFLTGEGRL